MENDNILKIKNISKAFLGTQALNNVSFEIKKGSVHCIIGQNGAGKSTLIKILAGLESPDEGEILINNKKLEFDGVYTASKYGLSFIFQEISVVDNLNVAENVTLGREKEKYGFINYKNDEKKVSDYFKEFNIPLDIRENCADLSIAKKQLLEIVKAVMYGSSIVLMDEPTSSLSQENLDYLFKMIDRLKNNGITVIFISHFLEDIFKVGDYVTILRDGKVVDTKKVSQTSQKELINLMIGKDLKGRFPSKVKANNVQDSIILEDITTDLLKNINLTIRKGEILGVIGLEGSGKTELARLIFGLDEPLKGHIDYFGENNNVYGKEKKIFMVPENRIMEGIIPVLPIVENISLSVYKKYLKNGLLNIDKLKRKACELVENLNIKCNSIDQEVKYLSGGNQQKVVLAKALNLNPTVLLLDEPTNGVDIGSKYEIYKIIQGLIDDGKAVILFSSDLDEIEGCCHRVIVLKDGEKIGDFNDGEFNRLKISELMLGVN